jgi:anion-transporting  ArsA/GET3 family ATPase
MSSALEGRLCICVGAGGVGKTTMAAAIALARAARGERVAVVTIDPAPRLARALGFDELGDEPRVVEGAVGELYAMRLDPKHTLDDLIASLAPDAETRERTLSNRIYRELSSAVAGAQEFSAVAKLYQLDREGGFDVIVLDTPPSRNALDFLDAPGRLTRFFDGRALRLVLAQGSIASRVARRAGSPILGMLERLLGGDVLREITTFATAIGSMVDGLGARAAAVEALLRHPDTRYVLVSSPRREAVEEAIAFEAELARAGLRVGALVVNRVHDAPAEGRLDELERLLGARLAGLVRASVAEAVALAAADRTSLERLRGALHTEPVVVPDLGGEVYDLEGLRRVAVSLGDEAAPRSGAAPSAAQ